MSEQSNIGSDVPDESSGDRPKRIAIIGASNDRSKYGNKAVRAYSSIGYVVYPVNPKEERIEGLVAYKRVDDIPDEVDIASLYVPPHVGITTLEGIRRKGARELFVNPGAGSPELMAKAAELGLEAIEACSILAVGMSPGSL